MGDLSGRGFGLLIAYLIPGFSVLWAYQGQSELIRRWLDQSACAVGQPSIGGFLYATVASIGAGIVLSGARWLTIDQVHAATGVRRPRWNDALLERRLPAFVQIVEEHYRYYQAYSNGLVALVICVALHASEMGLRGACVAAAVAVVLFLSSRDSLKRCYARGSYLLQELGETDDQRKSTAASPETAQEAGEADRGP